MPAFAQTKSGAAQEIHRNPRTFPLTKFYDTANFTPGQPGQVIRSEQFDQYEVPIEVLAVRILYHSRSAEGEDIPVSGVVLYPDGRPPVGGWPVIAWAHAFNGIARQCAPSLATNLQHGPLLSMYAKLGYAVVASDYAGLGAGGRNSFADAPSNATDVIYSVEGARAAVPGLSSRWVSVGIGEGANAAIAVAELEAGLQDTNYLGSVAIPGLDDPADRYALSQPASPYDRPLLLAYGIKTVFPDFDPKQVLTEKGLAAYPELQQSCGEVAGDSKPRASEMVKANWVSNRFVTEYFERNVLGQKAAKAPILVIAGELDSTIPLRTTNELVARMCKQGDQVRFEEYSQSDAAHVFGDSVRNQISWIEARFAAQPAKSTCTKVHDGHGE